MYRTSGPVPGRAPRLHDRFLVIDGAAWFLGGSLNAIGERPSLAVRLPDPEPVEARLEEIVVAEDTLSFENYAARPRREV